MRRALEKLGARITKRSAIYGRESEPRLTELSGTYPCLPDRPVRPPSLVACERRGGGGDANPEERRDSEPDAACPARQHEGTPLSAK